MRQVVRVADTRGAHTRGAYTAAALALCGVARARQMVNGFSIRDVDVWSAAMRGVRMDRPEVWVKSQH